MLPDALERLSALHCAIVGCSEAMNAFVDFKDSAAPLEERVAMIERTFEACASALKAAADSLQDLDRRLSDNALSAS